MTSVKPSPPLAEPPINRDPDDLDPEFRERLKRVLLRLDDEGMPFKFHEGFRTRARQAWLYASGRTRKGLMVTQKDGVTHRSNHQGTGEPGTGLAADCYPIIGGKVAVDAPDALWRRYAEIAESEGLTAGYRWTQPHDPPHVELHRSGHQ